MPSKTRLNKRIKAYQAGFLAEWAAMIFMMLKGYHPVARRAKTPLGEIDLIMRRGDILAVIEVKARRDFGAALEAVDRRNQKRVEQALRYFRARYENDRRLKTADLTYRFDVVLVKLWGGLVPVGFKHLDNAWQGRA